MEQTYWLKRGRASAATARNAQCSRSRLAHFELAGRYSVKAATIACSQIPVAEPATAVLQPHLEDGVYYAQLEEGARYLASRSDGETERSRHLSMANHYGKLRLGAGGDAL
jgi:hypothetical protein